MKLFGTFLAVATVFFSADQAIGQTQRDGNFTMTTTGFQPGQGGLGTVTVEYCDRMRSNTTYHAWVALKLDGIVVGEEFGMVTSDANGKVTFGPHSLQLAAGMYKVCASMREVGTTPGEHGSFDLPVAP